MIKKLSLLSALVLSVGVLVFPACGNEKLLSLEYEKNVYVQFIDPCGTFSLNNFSGYGVDYNGVTYKLAGTLTEEECNRTVTETSACLDLIEDKVGAPEENYTVYVVDDYYVPYTDGNTLYFGYENIKTAEFATSIVQLVYGRDVNYGVLYGLGASIASERGYENSLTKLNDALSLCETAPEYLDLNYACFLDDYADNETQAKVKTLSVEFYKFLEANGKTDLLTGYSDSKRRSYFNEFLAANGKGEYNSSDLDGIYFYGGGNAIRLFWENEHAKFQLDDDFKDYYQNGSMGEDPLNCGYTDLRKHIVAFEAQMLYIRERLAAYNDSTKKVTVKFNMTGYTYSFYDVSTHSLNIGSICTIKHEYTHSVLNSKYGFTSGANATVIHSLVHYFSFYPVDEQQSYLVQIMQDNIKNVYGIDFPEYYEFLDKFTEKLGHEIDLFDVEDCFTYCDYYAKYFGVEDIYSVTKTHEHYCSFANYLISRFGEEKVCDAAFNNRPVKVLGKTWEDIFSEWCAYLDENCSLEI